MYSRNELVCDLRNATAHDSKEHDLLQNAADEIEKLSKSEGIMLENWRRATKLLGMLSEKKSDCVFNRLVEDNNELAELRVAIHELEWRLADEDKKNPWVRVSDELPPADADVWVYGAGSVLYDTPVVAYMEEDGQWYGDDNCLLRNADQLTHWKFFQIPEPPKEDDKL